MDASSLRISANSGQALLGTPPASSLRLTTPNGGESWRKKSSARIAWTSTNITGKLCIELSRDGGATWATLFTATSNDGVHAWTVAGALTTRARLRITRVVAPAASDTSDADFRIYR